MANGKGLGVVASDFDLDGDVDIYVANDTVDNFFYLNDGTGAFVDNAVIAGVAGIAPATIAMIVVVVIGIAVDEIATTVARAMIAVAVAAEAVATTPSAP